MALDATIKGTASNSYVATIAEADTIAAILASLTLYGVSVTGWNAANDATKEVALTMAADRIDQSAFWGDPEASNQARAWPRIRIQQMRLNQIIPDAMKYAQVADACALLTSPVITQEMQMNGVKSFSIGEQSASFDDAAKSSIGEASIKAIEIMRAAGLLMSDNFGSVFVPRG